MSAGFRNNQIEDEEPLENLCLECCTNGSELWMIGEREKTYGFEMWGYRRMIKIH